MSFLCSASDDDEAGADCMVTSDKRKKGKPFVRSAVKSKTIKKLRQKKKSKKTSNMFMARTS